MSLQNKEIKKILRLGLPMVMTQLLWMSMPLVDNLMVGRLGAKELAAMALATTYFWLLQLVCFGILTAIPTLISHAFGMENQKAFRSIIQTGLVIASCLSGLMILAIVISESVLTIMNQPVQLISLTQEYLQKVVWGVPFLLGFMVLRHFFDAVQNPKPTIVLVLIGALLNIGLDYSFIYGVGPVPRMGLGGAGIATALIQIFLFFSLWFYLLFSPRYSFIEFFKKNEVSKKVMREILRLGIPSSGSLLAEMIYFSGSTFIMGWMGVIAIASHQIALNVASITFMIPLGIAVASSVRIGAFAGKKDWKRVQEAGKAGISLCLALGIFNALILLGFSDQIARLYNPDPLVIELASALLKIAGLFQIFDGLQVLGIQILRGLKDTKIPFINTLLSFSLLGLGSSLFFAFTLNKGPIGFWWGMILSLAVAAILHQFRFSRLIAVSLLLEKKESTQRVCKEGEPPH